MMITSRRHRDGRTVDSRGHPDGPVARPVRDGRRDRRRMRLAAAVLAGTVVLGAAHTATADAPASSPVPANGRRCRFPGGGAWFQLTPCDPHYILRHAFSLSPGVNPGWVTSCVDRAADA